MQRVSLTNVPRDKNTFNEQPLEIQVQLGLKQFLPWIQYLLHSFPYLVTILKSQLGLQMR